MPVHSTLLDDFVGRYLVNFDSRINEKEKNISRQENGSTVDYVIKQSRSLHKEESLACQKPSPFNKKLGCFLNKIKNVALQYHISFCRMGKLSGLPEAPLYLKSSMGKVRLLRYTYIDKIHLTSVIVL